jgi:hypothetical protein
MSYRSRSYPWFKMSKKDKEQKLTSLLRREITVDGRIWGSERFSVSKTSGLGCRSDSRICKRS